MAGEKTVEMIDDDDDDDDTVAGDDKSWDCRCSLHVDVDVDADDSDAGDDGRLGGLGGMRRGAGTASG